VDEPQSAKANAKRSLPRRLMWGALLGLGTGFLFAILLAIDWATGSSGNSSVATGWHKPGSIQGCLVFLAGFFVLLAVTLGGVYAGNALWPTTAGAIVGGTGAYALTWVLGGMIWGAFDRS
jgi:hypothetical protein